MKDDINQTSSAHIPLVWSRVIKKVEQLFQSKCNHILKELQCSHNEINGMGIYLSLEIFLLFLINNNSKEILEDIKDDIGR